MKKKIDNGWLTRNTSASYFIILTNMIDSASKEMIVDLFLFHPSYTRNHNTIQLYHLMLASFLGNINHKIQNVLFFSFPFLAFLSDQTQGLVHDHKMHHIIQIQTPRTIRKVPNKANHTRVSSPKSMADTAVAANVVALVTGTASDMGVSLKMAKKVAEADKFIKKGMEYCHVRRRLSQFL